MREEITEPRHWRTHNPRSGGRSLSWTSRRREQEHTELPAEAVDAALAEEATRVEAAEASDIVSNLSLQLDLLEKQREQLQQLLAQAQPND